MRPSVPAEAPPVGAAGSPQDQPGGEGDTHLGIVPIGSYVETQEVHPSSSSLFSVAACVVAGLFVLSVAAILATYTVPAWLDRVLFWKGNDTTPVHEHTFPVTTVPSVSIEPVRRDLRVDHTANNEYSAAEREEPTAVIGTQSNATDCSPTMCAPPPNV
ncbi:hypothetical protein MTO96_026774 [Rhipicephalus appendiculatus]